MDMNKCLLILLFVFPLEIWAQGLVLDDALYESIPIQSKYNDGGKSEAKALDGISTWSLKDYCPKVGDQGNINSCVGWSVGYAALSIEDAVINAWKGQRELITENAYSALFVYNQIKKKEACGNSNIKHVLDTLQKKGNILAREFDNNLTDCEKKPNQAQLAKAKENRIVDYMRLFDKKDNLTVKVNKVKISLVANKPVVVGSQIPNAFYDAKTDTWTSTKNEKRPLAHAMIIIGFDDSKQAFELMNSWGSTWGNKGFIWLSYDDFDLYIREAYQISKYSKIKRNKKFSAKFNLQHGLGLMKNDVPVLKNIKPEIARKSNIYKTEVFEKGDWFRLTVSEISEGLNLYAFNVDIENDLKLFFPAKNESGKISVSNVKLCIPDEENVLLFNEAGTEYIILLFSIVPIHEVHKKVDQLQLKKNDVLSSLYESLNLKVIPQSMISYRKDIMYFNTELFEGYQAIPIVLEINID